MVSVIAQGYAVSFLTNLALMEFLKIIVSEPVKCCGHAVYFRLLFEQRSRSNRRSRNPGKVLLPFEFVDGL